MGPRRYASSTTSPSSTSTRSSLEKTAKNYVKGKINNLNPQDKNPERRWHRSRRGARRQSVSRPPYRAGSPQAYADSIRTLATRAHPTSPDIYDWPVLLRMFSRLLVDSNVKFAGAAKHLRYPGPRGLRPVSGSTRSLESTSSMFTIPKGYATNCCRWWIIRLRTMWWYLSPRRIRPTSSVHSAMPGSMCSGHLLPSMSTWRTA